MAESNIGGLAAGLADLFKQSDGLKRFLEVVVQEVMASESQAT